MPEWIQYGPLQLCICNRFEAASLLGCSWEEVGKWVDSGLLGSVALPVPHAPGWQMRYPLYEEVCWLAEASRQYTTLSLEQVLWCRRKGHGNA